MEATKTTSSKTDIYLAQSLRLRRSLFATGAGFANNLVIYLAWVLGYVFVDFSLLASFIALSTLGYITFPLIIYRKQNLSFKDPSLTGVQISWQLIMLTVCMYAAPQLRVLLITNYLLILIFSIFKLKPKQMPYLAAGLISSYFAVILAQYLFSPISIDWTYELLISLVFVLAVVVVNLLAMEIAGLRMALKKRNRHLAIITEKNRRLAITDPLTGLFNRRQIMRDLRRQQALADRGNYEYSIVFIDLDYFKQVNDTYGHATGDAVLKKVAGFFTSSVRAVDYVGRLGGEEFILVLVQTTYTEALDSANRIREELAKLKVVSNCEQEFQITASFGVATSISGENVHQLIDRADKAVYAAKTAGRNLVVGDKEATQKVELLNLGEGPGLTGFEDPYADEGATSSSAAPKNEIPSATGT